MKIYKLSNVIATPFILFVGYMLYETFANNKEDYLAYAIAPAILVALIYMFQPQINYYWLSKYPPELDEMLLSLLKQTNPKYQSLSPENKEEFHKRLVLYTEGHEFTAKGMEQDFKLPYDVQNLIAQIPITMMWNKKDKDLKDFERIVTYKHPFGSPKYRFLHTVETDAEDGVIIFCLGHVEAAFKSPNKYYNIAWHGFAEAFTKSYPNSPFPNLDNDTWDKIENISGFPEDGLKRTLGYPGIDPLTVLIVLSFTHRSQFEQKEPALYKSISQLFL